MRRYGAFISYRRSSDEPAAATLQRELERFARRWYRPVRYRVFRDRTGATIGGALRDVLRTALRDSEFLILVASPESAAAPWVQEEVRQWLDDGRPLERLLIVVTAGTMEWNAAAEDFAWNETTAVPPVLSGRFEHVPSYLDLRWTRDAGLDENTRRGLWREAAATLSAKILGLPREELIGEEIRERKRFRRASAVVIALLTLLTALSSWLAYRAEMRRRVASSRQVALQALRAPRADEGLLLAVAACTISDTTEARGALLTRLQINRRLQRVLHGHATDVARVAVLDEQTCASGDWNGVILVHRVDDGRLLRELRGHDAEITALAAVPETSTLVSADSSGRLLVWDVGTGASVEPPAWSGRTRRTAARTMAVDAGGALLAVGDDGGVLSVIDLATRSLRHRHVLGDREIESIAWIDGRTIVAGTTAGVVIVARVDTGAVERRWKTGAADIALVGVARDGSIFALDQSGKLTQWRAAEGSEMHLGREVMGAAYDPVRDVIAAADVPGAIHLHSRETGAAVAPPLVGHALLVASAAFSRDGRFLVSGSFDETVMTWDLAQVHPIVAARHRFAGRPVARIRTDGTHAAFVARGDAIQQWSLTATGLQRAAVIATGVPVRSFTASGDGSRVLWTTVTNEVWMHDGKPRRLATPRTPIQRLSASEHGTYIAVVDDAHRIAGWGTVRSERWATPRTARSVTALAFSRDERLLAVGDLDGGLRLFDAATGTVNAERRDVHAGLTFSLAFDHRGTRIASGGGGGDRNIIVQELPLLTAPRRLRGLHLGPIGALMFDAEARLLASAANDGTVVLWDMRTLQPIGSPLAAHESIPHDVRLASDGATMLTSDDEAVLVWNLRVASWKKFACDAANRELTESEWRERVPDEGHRTLCGRE